MSQAEFYVTGTRWVRAPALELVDRLAYGRITVRGCTTPVACGMIETAENLRREFEISRDAQDQLAVTSHRRAIASQEAGRFADEIVPVPPVPHRSPRPCPRA